MNKILFTHSYFYKFDRKQWRARQPYPPLGTILAAAVAREKGYSVKLFDTNLRDDPSEISTVLQSHAPRYLVIYDDGFNYLTKMCLTKMRDAAFSMSALGRQAGCTVIVSSSDAADHYEKYFEHGADFVVRGEGEETLMELLDALDNDKPFTTIAGLAFTEQGQTKVTASRPVMRDLDALPIPAWDLVDIQSYRDIWMQHHGYFSLNVATTRGCPFKCNWCAKPIYGNRYVSRSPEHVVREIAFLLKTYQPDHFWMCDDIFGLKPGWLPSFSALVQEQDLQFRYKIQSRADLLLEEDTLDALARSGAETVWMGAESGAQKILDAMDKGTTVEQIYRATKLLKSKKINVAFFLQFGYPGETREDIGATINMLKTLMPEEVGISISYPLPGTKFYENVKHQLQGKHNWQDSDDLDMMFRGTYSRAYYKHLHRYVHSVYRRRKGFESLKKFLRHPLGLTRSDIRNGLATFYFVPVSVARYFKLLLLENVRII